MKLRTVALIFLPNSYMNYLALGYLDGLGLLRGILFAFVRNSDNHLARRLVLGLEPSRELLLGNPLPFTKVADVPPNRIINLGVHT